MQIVCIRDLSALNYTDHTDHEQGSDMSEREEDDGYEVGCKRTAAVRCSRSRLSRNCPQLSVYMC